MLTFRSGDLFFNKATHIVITVNAEGAMGRGIALTCKHLFPEVYHHYREDCKVHKAITPGGLKAYDTSDGRVVVTVCTKDRWRYHSKPKWVEDCIHHLALYCAALPKYSVVSIPPLGCGNGGLDWSDVKEKLQSVFETYSPECTLLVYEPLEYSKRYVTGVGSRSTTETEYKRLQKTMYLLTRLGYILRSGHANGSDMAFEEGCVAAGGAWTAEIYLPIPQFNHKHNLPNVTYHHFEDETKGYGVLSDLIAYADKLKGFARSAFIRNTYQVLGSTLDTPSDLLVCCSDWDGKGSVKGGTRIAWDLAKKHDIPCYNIRYVEEYRRLIDDIKATNREVF